MALKRSPLKRKTPMSSGGSILKRSAMARAGELARKLSRPVLKAKPPKMTPIRRSARGENCTLRFPGICRNNTDTTVWCHSNQLADGKGIGLKANDEAGCYGCFDCHSFLDGGWAAFTEWTWEMVQQFFEVARARSRVLLQRKGLIAV
jgi:hypothetical protein